MKNRDYDDSEPDRIYTSREMGEILTAEELDEMLKGEPDISPRYHTESSFPTDFRLSLENARECIKLASEYHNQSKGMLRDSFMQTTLLSLDDLFRELIDEGLHSQSLRKRFLDLSDRLSKAGLFEQSELSINIASYFK